MTFGYLWNAVRVQGGAYGTGMGARLNGNLFSYSYRDPNLENTRAAYCGRSIHFLILQGSVIRSVSDI